MDLKNAVKNKMEEIKLKRDVTDRVSSQLSKDKNGKYFRHTVTDENGNKKTEYYTRREIKQAVKDEINNVKNHAKTGNNKEEMIQNLKSQLEKEVSHYADITREVTNPRGVNEVGTQAKGRQNDIKVTKNNINKLVSDLSKQGVRVKQHSIWSNFKVVYEGGYDIMDRNEIKQMRLDVYEDAASGKISENMKEYLLTYLEYVDMQLQKENAYTEAVTNIIEKKRSDFIDYVERSREMGYIDNRQYEVMLEMSGEDFMFETPTPDDIPDLVMQYLEAAKDGDEEAKEQIKEKLDTAKELEKAANSEDDEVTEGACETIKDKIKELKIKLTDEEKEIVDKLDEKMKEAMGDECEGEESEGSDEPEGEDGKDDSDGKGNKDKKDEAPVEESTAGFLPKSGLSKKDKDDMIAYVKEAADEGVYTREELQNIINMLK